jgi:hypothetical protein
MNPRYGRGSFYAVTLGANFNTPSILSGHYGCHENIIVNCGTVTASFAFLVVALGVLIFGIYAARERRQLTGLPEESGTEEVLVDQEGWETKVYDEEELRDAKASKDEEGWEKKPEG